MLSFEARPVEVELAEEAAERLERTECEERSDDAEDFSIREA